MLSREELYKHIAHYLEELFEVPPEKISPQARLYEDLDLDSIDAVDLIVKLQELTKKKFKAEDFKAVRTISDVLDCVEKLLAVPG